MQCERLIKQVKTWYLHVKEETMAPARMIQFIKQHVESCAICQEEAGIHDEIEKITELILPESKIPKAVRMKQELEEAKQQAEEDEAKSEAENSEAENSEAENPDAENPEESEDSADTFAEDDVEEEPLTPDSTKV